MDEFDIIGVEPLATWPDIQKAYRERLFEHHPDRGGSAEDIEKIQNAYNSLKDPVIRQSLARDRAKNRSSNGLSDQFGDFFSTLEEDARTRGLNSKAKASAVFQNAITITLEEAYSGTVKPVLRFGAICHVCGGIGKVPKTKTVECTECFETDGRLSSRFPVASCQKCLGTRQAKSTNCMDCSGHGRYSCVAAEVIIPRGCPDEILLPLDFSRYENSTGMRTPRVKIAVIPHPLFDRDGSNLICELPIKLHEAIPGAKIEIHGIDGPPIIVAVRPGTNKSQISIPRKGMSNSHGIGNLIVNVSVKIPKPSQITDCDDVVNFLHSRNI